MCVRILAARCARALRRLPPSKTRGRRESRVRAAPAVSCANCTKKRTRAYRFSGGNPAFPAQWFYGLYRALPGDRAFLPPSPARFCSANLTPASGCQDHTPLPSASSRARRRNLASTASHRAFVTIATRPSHRVRRAEYETDFSFLKIAIFFPRGLDGLSGDLPDGLFCRTETWRLRWRAKRSNSRFFSSGSGDLAAVFAMSAFFNRLYTGFSRHSAEGPCSVRGWDGKSLGCGPYPMK